VRRLGRTAGVLLAVGIAVALVLLGVADLVATAVAESRLSTAVSDALGLDAAVELGPWPATPRLLSGELTVDVEASNAGDGEDSAVQIVQAELTGVELAEDRRSFTADTADLEATLGPAQAPFGLATATGTAADVRVSFGQESSTITAGRLQLQGQGTSASATQLRISLGHFDGALQRTALTAAGATLEADQGVGTGRLPLDVHRLQIEVADLDVVRQAQAPTRVRASHAALEADGLPLEGSTVRLDALEASIPALAVDHVDGAEQLVVTSEGTTFTAALDEQDLTELWPGPGNVELVSGVVRLSIGPFAIDVDVQVNGDQLQFTPLPPPAVAALLGDMPDIVVSPELPQGVTLSAVTIVPGTLRLSGGGDRVVLPLR